MFTSLEEAVKNASHCRELNISVREDFKDSGTALSKLTKLKKLNIHGDASIFDSDGFLLPSEIGKLSGIQMLSLLNLPLKVFPEWIFNLDRLEYLMIRGTDITNIPEAIGRLHRLKTLRVENCAITGLPHELKLLTRLRNLGLSDTGLSTINEEVFPISLRKINLAATACFADQFVNKRIRHAHVI